MIRQFRNTHSIKNTERKLYSRDYEQSKDSNNKRSRFKTNIDTSNVASDWHHDHHVDETYNTKNATKSSSRWDSFFNTVFIISVLFFVLTVISVGVLLYTGVFFGSTNQVTFTVSGPKSVSSGERVPLDINVLNDGSEDIQNARIIVEYPSHARQLNNPLQKKQRDEIQLSSITSQDQIRSAVEMRLFGRKDESIAVDVTLEYQFVGSNATLVKEKEHSMLITTSPLSVSVEGPEGVNANQEASFIITISSNTNVPLENIRFHAIYPDEFIFRSSDPESEDNDHTLWYIDTLKPEENREIVIQGIMQTEVNERRTLTFRTGWAIPGSPTQIDTLFDVTKRTLGVRPPHIQLSAFTNNSPLENFVTFMGDELQPEIKWINDLDIGLADANIRVRIDGNAVDTNDITALDGGFYRSGDQTVFWDQSTNNNLRIISSGSSRTHGIKVPLHSNDDAQRYDITEPHVTFDVLVTANQNELANVPTEVSASKQYTVKMSTNLGISADTLYNEGPFNNTGPVPPQVNETTSYTLLLSAGTQFNDVRDTKVRATLPPYVEWTGQTTTDAITYNSAIRQIVWDIGSMRSQTGFSRSPERAAIQVNVTPSISHRRNNPILLSDLIIEARDEYTDQVIKTEANAVPRTTIHSDEDFGKNNGDVQ